MQFSYISSLNDKTKFDTFVLPLDSSLQLTDSLQQADLILGGAITAAIKSGDVSGKLHNHLVLLSTSTPAQRFILLGTGEPDELDAAKYRKLVSQSWKLLKDGPAVNVCQQLCLSRSNRLSQEAQVRLLLEGTYAADYSFDQCKTGEADTHKPVDQPEKTIYLFAPTSEDQFTQSLATAKAMNFCRDLGNLPGNICTPTYLGEQALELASRSDRVTVDLFDEAQMEALGMHCLLSVGRGSVEPSRLIVLKYQGHADKHAAPHVLIGKGITFDSGGISIKPAAAMDEMKYDMCGAASVLGAMQAIVDMALPINLVVIVASAENMPSGQATKPGDVVTTMSGKTVEILNTDAEGRLVLCDAMTYAERFNPATVVDVATLTGACIVALGHHTTGMISNNDEFARSLAEAGTKAHDPVWQLPMGDDYQAQLKSNFADLANIGGRTAGTITAGCFLSRFAENYTWAHLDIAGTAWQSGNNKGSTGRCVGLLVQHLVDQVASS